MLWSTSGPKIAMKSDAFGQLAEKARDWVMPSEAGKTSAITHAPQLTARPGRRGRDEPVDRVPGGDGGEPGAQADVMIQRGLGMQVRLLQRPEHQGGGQEREQRCLRGAAPAGPADDDAADGQDQQQAGPGPGLAEHLQRAGRARDPGQHRPLETSQVAAPAGPHPAASSAAVTASTVPARRAASKPRAVQGAVSRASAAMSGSNSKEA